ncbi:MAG: ATP-binding protein [Spirochaetia bacterium]|jgi:hypothetical protein|nr:ATP-binding protein [Spirochaetia bacterium]
MSDTEKIKPGTSSGKLKIGNNWNAITIIALSQNNPLKAIAEFVENSIDAKAKNITILRGKKRNESYIKIIDDGEGISDFKYVATHIGDSIKRKLKLQGVKGLQGEFGIGLLSFWTVGEQLTLTSTGRDGIARRMNLVKGNPGYRVDDVRTLIEKTGTELLIQPLLSGVKQLSVEKIQNYLASELRDRIIKTGVLIKVIDRKSRKELVVEPRKFKGRLLHSLPEIRSPLGEIYFEIYLNEPSAENEISLYKHGTRVIPSIQKIDYFNTHPWNSPYLEGMIDVSFLQLTPGTRDGIILDDAFENFIHSIEPLTEAVAEIVDEQKRAEEEKTSKNILHRISKAIQEALNFLPEDDYGWLSIPRKTKIQIAGNESENRNIENGKELSDQTEPVYIASSPEESEEQKTQKDFYEIPGSLYSAIISPASIVTGVGEMKKLKIIARDKNRRQLDSGYSVKWSIREGEGELDSLDKEFVNFKAPKEPCIVILSAVVTQNEVECVAECIITVTEELLKKDDTSSSADGSRKGLPGYTYLKAPGELWRSRFDRDRYIIIINNGHADFIYASRAKTRKLRYISKLFTKELVLENFPEITREQLLERMIELQIYSEENLS